MTRTYWIAAAFFLTAGAARAHVTVSPIESRLGAIETYTLVVPTEGASSTTTVSLEVPPEVEIESVDGPVADYTRTKNSLRTTSITWHVNIAPGSSARLMFVAKNPQAPARGIRWKVHQVFADGSRADWIDPPPPKPAPSTRLLPD
jgi:uncharacterized protein YcnI